MVHVWCCVCVPASAGRQHSRAACCAAYPLVIHCCTLTAPLLCCPRCCPPEGCANVTARQLELPRLFNDGACHGNWALVLINPVWPARVMTDLQGTWTVQSKRLTASHHLSVQKYQQGAPPSHQHCCVVGLHPSSTRMAACCTDFARCAQPGCDGRQGCCWLLGAVPGLT
jgi:hypothetical protein